MNDETTGGSDGVAAGADALTGGTWYARRAYGQMATDDTTIAALGDGWWIFSDAPQHGDRGADAAAIAAAPQMLEALRGCLEVMDHMGDILNGMDCVTEEDEEFATPRWEAARAAIASATRKEG